MRYVYDIEQANFYMHQGVVCRGTNIHKTTKMVFFVFNADETTERAFKLWQERKKR